MKIVKKKSPNQIEAVTFRLPKEILDRLTTLAEKHDISRQKLLTAILEQALSDKDFRLVITE